MRIAHRVPTREPVSAVLDPDYEAQVQRSVAKAERAYAKAARDLARAERRLERVAASRDAKVIRLAREIVELRRVELEALEGTMRAAPASAAHRGVRSYRPVPTARGSVL